MKRSHLKRSQTPLKRTPLRKVSERRQSELKEYTAQKKEILEHTPMCVICEKAKAKDLHHVKPRGQGGDFLDPNNLIPVCKNCHDAVHFGATTEMSKDSKWYREWSSLCGSETVYYGQKWARHFGYLK